MYVMCPGIELKTFAMVAHSLNFVAHIYSPLQEKQKFK